MLIAERFQELQPSADALAGRIIEIAGEARPFVAELVSTPPLPLRWPYPASWDTAVTARERSVVPLKMV